MIKLKILIFSLLLLSFNGYGQNHPVTVEDGFFYLNGKKFFMKGMGIEIVRPGQEINSDETYDPDWFLFDVKRILDAGYNTIRTWGPQKKEQLDAVKDLDVKIVMGIWIPPHEDFTKSNFIDSSLQVVKDVLSYCKDYDNIIAYLIMNEPNTEDLMRDYSTTRLLYKTLVDEIHAQHPGTPVGMSAFPNVSYLEMDMFDYIGYNVHPETNPMQDFCYDYPSYINYLKQIHQVDKPLIVTEFGVRNNPNADNSRFPGETQEERQKNGLLHMYRSLIDGGAGGGCVFINADGWYTDGDVTNPDNDDLCGLIEYQSITDMVGTPRPAWYALKRYNTAVVTSPKNSSVYKNSIPVEIFGSDTIESFTVKADGVEILSSLFTENYFSGTIMLDNTGIKDTTFSFTFYDKDNNVVKEESIVFLTSDEEIQIPEINVTSAQNNIKSTGNITINYEFVNNTDFETNGEIKYASDPIISYDYDNINYTEPFSATSDYSFSKTYGTHFNSNVDILSFTNTPVLVFSAGIDILYGKFKKRITGYKLLWHDTSYVDIPERIQSEDCNFMSDFSGITPNVTEDVNGDWAIQATKDGSWLKYYVNVASAGDYKITFRYAAASDNSLTIKDGKHSYSVDLPATGGIQKWASRDFTINFTEGKHKLLFEATNSGLNFNWFEFSKATGINPFKNIGNLLISPNPVTDNTLRIIFPESVDIATNYQLKLFDLNGKIYYSNEIKVNSEKFIKVDLSNIKLNGIYLLSISDGENHYSQKLVVE